MANIASAKKRISVTNKKELRNQILTSRAKSTLKKYDAAIKGKNVELAESLYVETISIVDNVTSKGVWHKNKAARKKSAITRKLNSIKTIAAE